jgi:GLPGLI family protein
MKKFTTLFFIVFILAISINAQKRFSEATISYDIVINTGSDKPQAADFFDGATSIVYLKGSKSRTEMVSSLGTQATIIDNSKNTYSILREYGEQKFIINLTPANWKEANRKFENVQFNFLDETKTILSYKCQKAIGKLNDGTSFLVWYTTDILPENQDFQYANRNLPGLAMEYESIVGTLKVTYTVSKIIFSTVAPAKFDPPKSGYRVLTYEESKGQ